MKNFTQELKKIIKEDSGAPIMSPDELRARSQTIVILTDKAPKELLALAGPDRKATLLSIDPPMITLPYQKGVFKVSKDAIVFENHHSGRDVTEAGADETPYEKFFSQAMKKFGVSSPIELDPEDTKKFFNYVDKNWEAEEETDVDENAEGGMSMGQMASDLGGATSRGTASVLRRAKDDEDDEETTEDVSTGKVGKKDKGSYQHAYKLALKKYQIHSADELDTPAERKGFTDYVDRLWKKGDIHRDKKEASIDIDEITSQEKAARKVSTAREKEKRGQTAGQQTPAEKQKKRDAAKKADDREKRKKEIKRKSEQQQKERERDQADRERDQAAREREREQEKDDNGKDDDDDKKDKPKSGFLGQLGAAAKGAAASQVGKYSKEAAIPEGVKKTPGVSKKAKGAVGFAKHARKGTGAKRQFQKGVRQAGKKQARNEVSPPDRKEQVKGIKKHMAQKKGKDKIPKTYVDKKTGKRKETNPWALAWAQYDKYGVPSRIEKD